MPWGAVRAPLWLEAHPHSAPVGSACAAGRAVSSNSNADVLTPGLPRSGAGNGPVKLWPRSSEVSGGLLVWLVLVRRAMCPTGTPGPASRMGEEAHAVQAPQSWAWPGHHGSCQPRGPGLAALLGGTRRSPDDAHRTMTLRWCPRASPQLLRKVVQAQGAAVRATGSRGPRTRLLHLGVCRTRRQGCAEARSHHQEKGVRPPPGVKRQGRPHTRGRACQVPPGSRTPRGLGDPASGHSTHPLSSDASRRCSRPPARGVPPRSECTEDLHLPNFLPDAPLKAGH